ncbi:MAG: squalene/phytoene synthase family protein [Chthoniobacterales bacterium]|nr:squalene/phytoene synthase family protein [Chthoniobacterales bacterium]
MRPSKIIPTRIFHNDRDEEAAKADGERYVMKSDNIGACTHSLKKTSKSTLHPAGFPVSADDPNEILGLTNYDHGTIFQSNLAIALYLLPRTRRKDALHFYNFCHWIDECIDSSTLTLQEKENILKMALQTLEELKEQRHLDPRLLEEIMQGMQMDLTINRYETFEDLRLYAWRVASAVGLVSAQLFGASGVNVNNYAEQLGLALQLTNILRDVALDAAMNRIYIPLEDLARFQVTEKEILSSSPSPQATHLFEFEAERALSFFAKARLAWEKMSPCERHLMRPARLMEAIYRTLLEKMQHDRYDLFHQRYRIGIFQKIILATQVFFSC